MGIFGFDEPKDDDRQLSHKCQICERYSSEPVGWRKIMSPDEPCYCCKTCFSIWYDGCTDGEEIKYHSLHWPMDSCAYVKSSYEPFIHPDFEEKANYAGE